MAKYQNIGTFDAGVVNFSGAAAAAAVPTMDAAGIASGGAFLVSELEKRDPMIRKPLTSFTYPRDIVIQTGGGWVDYVSAMSVGYGTTGGSGASLVQAGGSNGIPIVQANVDKGIYKAHAVAMALRVMFQDMQRANFIGRSIDQLLQDGVRLTYDKHLDQNVYVGFSEYNTTGLVNNPDATASTVADGASGNGNWATKTPNEILTDVNTALTATWAQASGAHDAYQAGDIVNYNGTLYQSLIDGNVWSPDVYPAGWEVYGESPDPGPGPDPDPDPTDYPEWVQPTGAHDAYPMGATVSHNGKHWVSTANANVWEPGVYGWEEVTDG